MKKEDIEFLKELQHELNTQPNDGNADPIYWGIMETKEVAVPNGCGNNTVIYVGDGGTQTLEEYIEYVNEGYIDELNDDDLEEWKELTEQSIFTSYDYDQIIEFTHDKFGWNDYLVDVDDVDFLCHNTGAFLTKRSAQEYIKNYGYNHSKPRTWAMTAFRNYEYERLLKILKTANFDEIPINSPSDAENSISD